jgi:hypothetical protein
MGIFKNVLEIKFTNSEGLLSSSLAFKGNFEKFLLRKTGINTNRNIGKISKAAAKR